MGFSKGAMAVGAFEYRKLLRPLRTVASYRTKECFWQHLQCFGTLLTTVCLCEQSLRILGAWWRSLWRFLCADGSLAQSETCHLQGRVKKYPTWRKSHDYHHAPDTLSKFCNIGIVRFALHWVFQKKFPKRSLPDRTITAK